MNLVPSALLQGQEGTKQSRLLIPSSWKKLVEGQWIWCCHPGSSEFWLFKYRIPSQNKTPWSDASRLSYSRWDQDLCDFSFMGMRSPCLLLLQERLLSCGFLQERKGPTEQGFRVSCGSSKLGSRVHRTAGEDSGRKYYVFYFILF